jgi:hypothetical protein
MPERDRRANIVQTILPRIYLASLVVFAGCDSGIPTNSGSKTHPTPTPTEIPAPPLMPGETRRDCLPVVPQKVYQCPQGTIMITEDNQGDITATQGESHIDIPYSTKTQWGDVSGSFTNCSEVVEAQNGKVVTVYESCQNSPSGQ